MANTLSTNFNDSFARTVVNGKLNFAFQKVSIPEAVGTQDFLGVNYYTVELIKFMPLEFKNLFYKGFYDPKAEISPTGFLANVPEGLYEALKWANGLWQTLYGYRKWG